MRMKHLTPEDCVDLVRGTSAGAEARELRAHVDTGCGRCARELSLWTHFADTLARDAEYEPSPEVVRITKAQFAMSALAKPKSTRIAQLLIDTALQPLAAGVRSAGAASRHLMYGADDVVIDVQLSRMGTGLRVVGQVLSQKGQPLASPSAAAAQVSAFSDGRSLASATANGRGEFHMIVPRAADLMLAARLSETTTILLEIPRQPHNQKDGEAL